MRGFYDVEAASFCGAIEHLLGMPHVTVERWEAVKDAVDLHRRGFDFADALHWATSASCNQLLSTIPCGIQCVYRRLRVS